MQDPAPQVVPGIPRVFQGSDATSPAAIYEGYRAQRRELSGQLEELEDSRGSIAESLLQLPAGDPGRKVLETRLAEIDKRIVTVDGMIASNSARLAQAAAVPGAVVQPPRFVRQGPPEEVYMLGGLFLIMVFFPLSVALARRIWRRSVTAVTTFPRELADRLSRMEHAVEATSLEVERIGEGQRFLTRLLTENEAVRSALPQRDAPLALGQPPVERR